MSARAFCQRECRCINTLGLKRKTNSYTMSCTTVFRTACSFLNKAPTLLSRRADAHWFLECRLLTPRHFASISKACGPQNLEVKNNRLMKKETNIIFKSHNRCYRQNNGGIDRDMGPDQIMRQKALERLQSGKLQVPDLRNVTSVPPMADLENSHIVALDVRTMDSGLFSIHAVSDTEQFIKICRRDGDLSDYLLEISGLEYDENRTICWPNGQPVETVEQQEAVQEFINFLKKYDNPLLLVYDGGLNAVLKMRNSSIQVGLYDEFLSASPYYIDLSFMVRKNVPRSSVPSYKLKDLCKELLDMDVVGTISRLTGMKMLFTDILLPRDLNPIINCTDYFSAKDCYAEMVVENHIHPFAVEKLANAGLRLDHLKFLKEQGEEAFKKELMKRKLQYKDIGTLYSLVSLM